jgi:type I restriction enzyme S subunit
MRKSKNNNNNLPKGWRKVKLGEIAKVETGGTPSRRNPKYFKGGKIPWLKTQELNDSYIYDSEEKITEEALMHSNAKLFPVNTVLIAMYGATVGKLGYLKMECSTNQAFAALLPNPEVYDSKFLFYLLLKERERLISVASGAAQQNLNLSIIKNFEIFIPEDISEQKRIADILSAFDDKIELNNKIIKTLEEMAQEIFKEWFVRFRFPGWQKVKFVDSELGKIPEGWEVSKIGEKLTTILGGTPSTRNKSYWENGNIPWINSGAINEFPVINPTSFITKKGLKNSAAKLMPTKTVVLPLVISVGKLVKISMLAKEMSGNQSVVGIVGNDKITPEFIYCWVQYKKQEIYGSASGGAQQHINKNIIDSTLILIPKGEILDSFNRKVVPLFDTIIKKAFENQTLSALRDLLLPKLMSGEIRV